MALAGKTFVLCNVPDQAQIKKCVVENGGKVVFTLSKLTSFMITTPEEVAKKTMKIRDALRFRVPVISKDYVFAIAGHPETSVQPYVLVSAPAQPAAQGSARQEGATGEWRARTMRVFVSSTFLDMRKEREVLTQEVFPYIRRFCHERNVLFSYVDLRWGIPTEEVAGGKTISLCLDEVDACRPYFIGILGERYGWSLHTSSAAAREILNQSFEYAQAERPWLSKFTDRSVTELEILYALGLHNEETAGRTLGSRSCFYFRDPKYVDNLPANEVPQYKCENDEAAAKLRALKETVKKSHVPLTENYKSQEDLKKAMIADLVQRIEEDFPTHSLELLDPELLATFSYAQSLVAHIPPNSAISADMLAEYVGSRSGNQPLVVVGESGVGKSTLLADYLLKIYEKQAVEESAESDATSPIPIPHFSPVKTSQFGKSHGSPPKYSKASFLSSSPSKPSPLGSTPPKTSPLHSSSPLSYSKTPSPKKFGRNSENDILSKIPGPNSDQGVNTNVNNVKSGHKELEELVIPHFVGCYPTSTNRYEILRKIITTLQKKLHISLPIPVTDEDLVLDFPLWVTVAGNRAKIVLLLDGIDRLDSSSSETPHQALEWLPHKFHRNFRVVITVSPNAAPGGIPAASPFGKTYLAEFEKRGWMIADLDLMTEDAKQSFVEGDLGQFGKRLSASQMAKVINAPQTSWPVFLKGLLDELRIYSHFDDIDQHIDDCLEAQDSKELFDRLIKKWESEFPDIKQLLTGIYVAPRGMSEEEILEVAKISKENWAKMVPVIFDFFVRTPLWNFASPHFKECVKEKYFTGPNADEISLGIHKSFVEYFESKPLSLRKVEALPYHLLQTQQVPKLKNFLLGPTLPVLNDMSRKDLDHFAVLCDNEASKKLFQEYWRATKATNKEITDAYMAKLQQYKWSQPPIEELASRIRKLGIFFTDLAAYDVAVQLFDEAVLIDKRIYGVVHSKVAEDIQHQVTVNLKMAKYDMAESLAEQVLELYSKIYGRDNTKCAESLTLLAMIYKKQAEYEKAESMYSRALQIMENHWRSLNTGSDLRSSSASSDSTSSWSSAEGKISDISFESFKVAVLLKNFADVRRKLGHFEESYDLYVKALSIVEATRGGEHEEVADILRNIGLVLKKRAKYDQAKEYYKRAMGIIAKIYGQSHVLYGQYMYDLGDLMRKQDQFHEAQILYNNSMKILTEVLGPNHPEIAEILNSIGLALKKEGKYEEAAEAYRKALEIVEKCFGKDHPKVGMYLNNLADCYRKLSRYDVCMPLYARALDITVATYGNDHPEVAEVLNNMGLVAKKRGLYDEAEPMYKQALAIITKHFGSDHPKIGMYLTNLGDIYRKKAMYKVALNSYERAITILIASLGEGHSEVAEVLHSMGLVHMQLNNFPRSQSLLNSAIKSVENELGSTHPKVGMYLNSMGESKLKRIIFENEAPKSEGSANGRPSARQFIVSLSSSPSPSSSTSREEEKQRKKEEEEMEKRKDVEETLQRALEITENALGENHIEVADIVANLGLFHLKITKKYSLSWDFFARAARIVLGVFGPEHAKYKAFTNNLREVLEASNGSLSKSEEDIVAIAFSVPLPSSSPSKALPPPPPLPPSSLRGQPLRAAPIPLPPPPPPFPASSSVPPPPPPPPPRH
eukprot:Phypoly_transcript_00354.p1 GENE.Phypoly_transcript_00354~~Phypoly_transcript_00354.p1  ORF type:complete len:1644 (+),score=368.57 Phypoly_transcript_00354:104-5035(+)